MYISVLSKCLLATFMFITSTQNISNLMFCVVSHFSESVVHQCSILRIPQKKAHTHTTTTRSTTNFHKSHDLMFKRDRAKLILDYFSSHCRCHLIPFNVLIIFFGRHLTLLLLLFMTVCFIHSLTPYMCLQQQNDKTLNKFVFHTQKIECNAHFATLSNCCRTVGRLSH